MDKQKVIILFGGRSAEHEISCRSAAFIAANIDQEKYDVSFVAIDQAGQWIPQDEKRIFANKNLEPLLIVSREGEQAENPSSLKLINPSMPLLTGKNTVIGEGPVVVFPIIHGTFGEDGTLQGMLEMADVAFVGCDTLASAASMDKDVAKVLVNAAGIPVVPWLAVRAGQWSENREEILSKAQGLGDELFIKPAKLGSSVGISKARGREELTSAVELALKFDDKILIEKSVNVREIELAALGEYDPQISIAGEVVAKVDFYDFESKYIDADASEIKIPAEISDAQLEQAKDYAKRIFLALNLFGMSRIDLFLEKETEKFYFNEVNTIPGLTEISQYPLLWKASGVNGKDLITKLVELALVRYKSKQSLQRSR